MPDDPKDTQGQAAGEGPAGQVGIPGPSAPPEARGVGGGDVAAPQTGTPAGGTDDWKAKYEAEAQRRSSMQAEFDRLRGLEKQATERFGPPDKWETTEPEETPAEQPPPGVGGWQQPQAPLFDPYGPGTLAQWAKDSFDGADSPSAQIAFARRFDSFLRQNGVVPPWDGWVLNNQQPQARQPVGNFLTKDEAAQMLLAHETTAETVEDGIDAIETAFGKDFLNQTVKDASGRDTTLVRALRTRCLQERGATPEQVLRREFEGYWERAKEAQIEARVRQNLLQQQATMGDPYGRGGMAPIPEPAPNAAQVEALRRSGEDGEDVALDKPRWQGDFVVEPRRDY